MKVGIPRSLFYYYYSDMWIYFFEKLNISYVISPETNKEIMELGCKYANDEMCLSLKNYIGHVAYLSTRCDVLLIPRIDNYGYDLQTCTNFLSCYDIIHNLFSVPIIDYNICYTKNDNEYKAFYNIGRYFKFSNKQIHDAYIYALTLSKKCLKKKIINNNNLMRSPGKKVLIVSHPYNTYDKMIGKPVIDYLKSINCKVIYSDLFDKELCISKSLDLCPGLYWKFSREIIGSIILSKDYIDGVIFLSTFPCGLDSIVNELVIRKLDIKCLNLVIDNLDGFAGLETRLESFVDILV